MIDSFYDDKTMAFTNNGWKLFKDSGNDDMIYSLNPYSMEAEWCNYIEKQEIPYNGELLHFENLFVDLCVTPSHKMFNSLINRNYARSKTPKIDFFWDAQQTFDYLSRNNNIYQTIAAKDNNLKYGNDNDFLIGQFIGFYLGDGYTQYLKDKAYAINFGIAKERKIIYLTDILSKLGFIAEKTNVCKNDGIRKDSILFNIKFSKNDLSFILPYIGYNAKDKCIPKETIKQMSYQMILGILDGLENSDGTPHISKEGEKTVKISSRSTKLLKDIEHICIISGIYAKCHTYYREEKKGTDYVISILYNKNNAGFRKEHIKKEKYNGYVYNVALNKNYILLVKRGDKICFSGNQ